MVERESLMIRFLYDTVLGRLCLKALVRPGFSEKIAGLLSCSASRALIRPYIRRHHILMESFEAVNTARLTTSLPGAGGLRRCVLTRPPAI